jgi:putative endonuclease
MSWFIYVVRCRGGSLYCGASTDVEKRVACHNSGKGAKYTKAHRPVVLVWQQKCKDKSDALKREYAFKQLTKKQKEMSIKKRKNTITYPPSAILRCIWCIKDTKTNPCEHCGSDQVVDRTVKHAPHWSRATMNTVECKICDRSVPNNQQYIPGDKCEPTKQTKQTK